MEEVRQLVQEEGREARNLVAFHVAVDSPARVSRKPPRILGGPPPRQAQPRVSRRSASAGRDKRSELRARYWALLFGDLQRAIGEIYNTVEAHENLNECQEVILVLENYTRDFKALGEWFRLKWEYDNTPPPQRPQSLAWEIRKTDFVRPESRKTYSVRSSPSVSGKNSPCLSGNNTPSGKNSPNLTGKASPASGKMSPRVGSGYLNTSPKGNIEFFSSKIVANKMTVVPEPKLSKENSRLSDITEKDVKDMVDESVENSDPEKSKFSSLPTVESPDKPNLVEQEPAKRKLSNLPNVETGKEKESASEKPYILENTEPAKRKLTTPPTVEIEKVKNCASEKPNVVKNTEPSKRKLTTPPTVETGKPNESASEKPHNVENTEPAKRKLTTPPIVETGNANECASEKPNIVEITEPSKRKLTTPPTVEIGKAKECASEKPNPVIFKSLKRTNRLRVNALETQKSLGDIKNRDLDITAKLDAMETEFLSNQISENKTKNENMLNNDREEENIISANEKPESPGNIDEIKEKITVEEKCGSLPESPVKSEDNFADISNESSKSIERSSANTTLECDFSDAVPIIEPKDKVVEDKESKSNVQDFTKKICNKDVVNVKDERKDTEAKKDVKTIESKPIPVRPAYSQAAAKPKPVTAVKTEIKTPTKMPLTRSKTIVEINSNNSPKAQRPFPKKNVANKCSYPFNLTTGRTSLFDTPSNQNRNVPSKRTAQKNFQMGAGDAKSSQMKTDSSKSTQRPTSLKLNDKSNVNNNVNPALSKIKDFEEYSSTDSVVTQIDMSRIESSESLKTIVPDDLQMFEDVANSIEVLNINKSDNEGWFTVKSKRLSRESKRQSKSHWAQRFHQPSATTSLPTLNMIESPKQETKPIVDSPENAKLDRAKSEQPEVTPMVSSTITQAKVEQLRKDDIKPVPEIVTQVEAEKLRKDDIKVVPEIVTPAIAEKPKNDIQNQPKIKDLSMIRQKSDITGLKSRSSRSKAMKKSEKHIGEDSNFEDSYDLTKSRLHSSLESLTTALERSQESTEEAFDFYKWKTEFKSTFTFLDDDDQMMLEQEEILETADATEISEIAEMTSQIEENEKKLCWALDFQSEVDQKKLCEEEDLLNRQIMELQQVSDIDLDTETDDTETDAEVVCEEWSRGDSLAACYSAALAAMSRDERSRALGTLAALEARHPGRAQQLHAKLSQGIKRRGSLQDALRRLQQKQARAERQRIEYQTERAKKIHQLLARVEEVKVAKNQLIEEKRLRMEKRLEKAAENRNQHLKDIVRKAHDEEEKLREIAFIKQLEAENRRHDFLDQCRLHTTRLRQMRRERITKLEQKAAREAAVGARRLQLEAARRQRVEELVRRSQQRARDTARRDRSRRDLRHRANRQKAEGVKSRLSALAAAAELEADALRSRIRDKQDASQQRLESHLQAIREKAVTGQRQVTTSESLDQSAKEEKELAEQTERLEQERREKEKQKAIKKKARKVKQKLLSTSDETIALRTHSMGNQTLMDFVFPLSAKLTKVMNNLSHIIAPILEPDRDDTQSTNQKQNSQNIVEEDDDENKNNRKNNKIKTNGDFDDNAPVEKKKNKKKKTEKDSRKSDDNVENNNNSMDTEIIDQDDCKTDNGKKKKKSKSESKCEKPKLSKADSVCSSLSDMSRASNKSEKRAKVTIDLQILERLLNELHRIAEKFPNNTADKLTFQKLNGIKLLAQLLTIGAEKEEFGITYNTKILTTLVMITSRVMISCSLCGSCVVMSSASVHLIRLLGEQLERDLSDPKEMQLAKQITDCLSLALDSVLCTTRHCEENKDAEEQKGITIMRSRAHTVISYLCLSGCIDLAENAGEARESMQTLLTVCADLCQPSDVDMGPERSSATQALRRAMGTSMCGSRAEFCGLFAEGARLAAGASCPPRFVRAARTAHLLRALAELDHTIVQEAFGEAGWPLEFRAAVARLLSQHAPNDKEAPRTTRLTNQRLDQSLSETMVLDLIVLIGFVIVNNRQLQATVLNGWSVGTTLCQLPANWLVSPTHGRALIPTLAALAACTSSVEHIQRHISVKIIEDFMSSPEAQNLKLVQLIKQGQAKKAAGSKK